MTTYNSELQSNNADLQAILDTVNALPDAGGGSNLGYAHLCSNASGMAHPIVFEVGMTWEQYIASDYNKRCENTSGDVLLKCIILSDGYVSSGYSNTSVVTTDGTLSGAVSLTDVIESGAFYAYYNN